MTITRGDILEIALDGEAITVRACDDEQDGAVTVLRRWGVTFTGGSFVVPTGDVSVIGRDEPPAYSPTPDRFRGDITDSRRVLDDIARELGED